MPSYISGEYIAYLLVALFTVAYMLSRNDAARRIIQKHGTLLDLLVIAASIAIVLAMLYLPTMLAALSPTPSIA